MFYIFLASRILFGGYFIVNGVNHLLKGSSMVGYAVSKKIPMPQAMIIISGLLILLGGLGILVGFMVPFAVLFIEIFLVVVTFTMHDFWMQKDAGMRQMEYIQFTKNLALIGGALAFLFI